MKVKAITLDTSSLTRKQLAGVALALELSPRELKRDGIPEPENRKQAAMLRMKLERLGEQIH